MEIRELVTFLSLAKTLNYQKSAAELQYAPSTLKKHISNLEVELRVLLFEKKGRGIQMTQEGRRFIEYAQDLVSGYNEAVEHLSGRKLAAKPLTVAGCEANLLCEMEEAVQAYVDQNADHQVLKSICSNSAVVDLVKCGSADIGVCYTLDTQPISGLESIMLYCERLHWMAHKDHQLTSKKQIHYEDFKEQSIITQSMDSCLINEGLRRIREKGVNSVDLLSVFFCNIQRIDPYTLKTKCLALSSHNTLGIPILEEFQFLDVDEEPFCVWNRIVVRKELLQDGRIQLMIQSLRKAADQRIAGDQLSYVPYIG